ncbi:hypothetical protein M501DRAFT_314102 [Patellaria atrata CBS 101060]|uniref:Ankyrin n=1 Tax=Patellaria atrata CBS 101060 TaxID=1346257 RepID=A0A9P4S479_9PEZI|nr:hypothetical protein M501DRAFT_314102 [Patellaria atrata CBS 101060]
MKRLLNIVDWHEMLPIHLAAKLGNLSFMSDFLDYTENSWVRDRWGRTVFYLAACRGHEGVLRWLIHKKLTTKDLICGDELSQRSPAHFAALYEHKDSFNLIMDHYGLDRILE